jgi:hypothetical protein
MDLSKVTTSNDTPSHPFSGRANCEVCGSRMAWIYPGKWHCDYCPVKESKKEKTKPKLQRVWEERVRLHAEADKLYAESNMFHAEGDKLHAEGSKPCDMGSRFHAEGSRLHAEADKIYAEGSRLRAEGSKLCAEGDKFRAEANLLWATKILETYGNIKMEWKDNGDCWLDVNGGELYKVIKNEM